jgi:N-acetylglucosamine malate deacetylase 1
LNIVLVVAPHPDDETLGCGGTLLRHVAEGDSVHWLIMSTIEGCPSFNSQRIESRSREIAQVSEIYGFQSYHQTDLITTQLDVYPKADLVDAVSKVMSEIQPDTVYMPFRNDVHSDHGAVVDAVVACTKSFRYPHVRRVRVYETLSETEFSLRPNDNCFNPNLWVDIGDYLEKKIEIMKMYDGEIGEHPFPRSARNIRALATYRGAVAGVSAAEAFVSLKEIV